MESGPKLSERDPRVYLAVERTYLSWMRTGLSLMGFGFVVARFGLFLRELSAGAGKHVSSIGVSATFGTVLGVVGVLLTVAAVFRYVRLLRKLDRGEELRGPSWLAVAIGVTLAVTGAAVVIWVFLVSSL